MSLQTIFTLFSFCLLAIGLLGCGKVHLGNTGTGSNSGPPTGKLVSQGQIFGQSGITATGTAQIYSTASGGFVLYLSGLSLSTAPAGLVAHIYTSLSGLAATVNLTSTSGNAQYPFSSSAMYSSFTSVTLFLPSTNENFATATLSVVN